MFWPVTRRPERVICGGGSWVGVGVGGWVRSVPFVAAEKSLDEKDPDMQV